ncbi:MAG: hypothetical protein HPY58_01895 [Firmicutes bacterium]|nr:hypothetical protein [Bacillota bacterium]
MATRSYRDTASFGKRQEYVVIAELLRRGFDVYQTLVDDQGIDCVIRREKNGIPDYLEIQVKARSKDCNPKNAGRFVPLDIPAPRPNYFFIFYSEQANAFWVVPSIELVKVARQNKTGRNKGRYSINFCNIRADGTVVPRPVFDCYKNRFDLLK